MATVTEIIRCLKKDMAGDLLAGAEYADRVSANAARNPWACPGDAENYREAAAKLLTEYQLKEGKDK
jgi:hypothetical protein